MLGSDDAVDVRPARVAVAGVSGVGKTTAAGRIAETIGSSHHEIDALFHGPGWVPRPSFVAEVTALVATESWVIEWQYDSARDPIADRCDVLVGIAGP